MNGISTVVKEVRIESMENLVSIVDEDLSGINPIYYGFCIIASLMEMDMVTSLGETDNEIVGHHDNGLSSRDSAIIFIMERYLNYDESRQVYHKKLENGRNKKRENGEKIKGAISYDRCDGSESVQGQLVQIRGNSVILRKLKHRSDDNF